MKKESIDEVMRSLYYKKEAFFVDMFGKVKSNQTTLYNDRNNCTSLEHVNKWLSINDLLNVSCFINQNWQPDWENKTEEKYTFTIKDGGIAIEKAEYPVSIVYFPEISSAQQVLDIIGKEKILQILK
ncbi:MAG: hypothetical protein FWH36_01515 [Lentimicrobiaceae bacterium]|nr:hypothetical protein [Lentimicrobiaceae bacterium]